MSAAALRGAVKQSVGGLPSQFWWLWTSTLVNRLGSFVATFLALYLTVERGYSASYAGLVGGLYGAGGVVASLGAGVLTDRLGRRPTMLLAQLSSSAAVSALAFVRDPAAIAAVAFAVGLATNASRPAVQAMMADVVPARDRVRAFALLYWAINLGFAVSSASAGLIARYSYHWLFFGEAAMVLCCAVLAFVKLPESRPKRPQHPRPDPDPASAVKSASAVQAEGDRPVSLLGVFADGRFMTVVGLNFLLATLFQQGFVALPIAMGRQGFGSSDFGLAIATNGVLIVALQVPVTRLLEHRAPARLLVVSALLTGYGFGLQAFAGSVAFYVLAIAVWTLGEIINSPIQMGLVVRLSPLHGRGRYQGVFSLSWAVASLGAPLMGGFVIDRLGADALWGISALIGTVAALGYGLLLRRLRSDEADGSGTGADSDAEPEPEPGPEPAAGVDGPEPDVVRSRRPDPGARR